MEKKQLYSLVKNEITEGRITSLNQIFSYLHKTTVARDIKIHPRTLNNIIKDAKNINFKQAYLLADLLHIGRENIIRLIEEEINLDELKHKK